MQHHTTALKIQNMASCVSRIPAILPVMNERVCIALHATHTCWCVSGAPCCPGVDEQ